MIGSCCVSLDLLEESVKQCEELKLLSEMRARKKENRTGKKRI